jgi:predicted Zn-dependent protease with MMP-like domain
VTPEAAESSSENSQPALQPRQTTQPGSPQQGPVRAASARRTRRGRDRRGRGLRGRLAPPEVPISRTRSEQFDDLVLDAVEHLEQRWADELDGVEFAVEEVPDDSEQLDAEDVYLSDAVPLARLIPGSGSGRNPTPPRIVVYRRPIEARAPDREDAADLVLDVLVHEVARLLDVEPEVIDPEGHGGVD